MKKDWVCKEEMICEVLKPKECFILWMDDEGIMYVGNKNGKVFIAKALNPEK